MGQIKLVGGILLASLLAFALISYIVSYGNDNSAEVKLGNVSGFTDLTTEIEGNVTVFYQDVNSSSTAFTESTIEESSDSFKSPSVFQTLFFIPTSIYSVFNLARTQLFGSQFAIFFTTLTTFLVFISVLYIWKTFRGDPD